MTSKTPIVRQIAWISLIPQLLLLACIIAFLKFIGFSDFLTADGIIYLAITFTLRFGIPTNHRKGIALMKKDYSRMQFHFLKRVMSFFKRMYG